MRFQRPFQLPQFRLPAHQSKLTGHRDLQVIRGRFLGMDHRRRQRVRLMLCDHGRLVVTRLVDPGQVPVPEHAAAVHRDPLRRVHQPTPDRRHGLCHRVSLRDAAVERRDCPFTGIRMHRSRQNRHLGHAGVCNRQRRLCPSCHRRKLFLDPSGDQRHVDASGSQSAPQVSRGDGIRAAVFLLEDDRPAVAQGGSVNVGHVVMIWAAFQQALQRVQRGRPRMVQRHLDVESLQRGHRRFGQAGSRCRRFRHQWPRTRRHERQRARGKHQHLQRVFLSPLRTVGRRLRGGLTHYAHQSIDEISQRRVVHQLPGQRHELRPRGHDRKDPTFVAAHHFVQQRAAFAFRAEGRLEQQSSQVAHGQFDRFNLSDPPWRPASKFGVVPVQRCPFLVREVDAEAHGWRFARLARRFYQSHLYLSPIEQIVDFQTSGHFGDCSCRSGND